MQQITASQVKELRERTGAPMMECKKFLQICNGDIEKAIEEMRKAGQAKAIDKARKIAAEGLVVVKKSVNNHEAIMLEVNCETDFVAKSEQFINFVDDIAEVALKNNVDNLNDLLNAKYNDDTVEVARQNVIAKIGENIQIRRVNRVVSDELLGTYNHGSKIGVIVKLVNSNPDLAKDLAMHIAATNPAIVKRSDVTEEMIGKEKEVFVAQAKESGKPADIIDRMVQGRMKKYVDEIALEGQPFVKDPSVSVEQILKDNGSTVTSFVRFEVGYGIEKKKDNFVEEVMSQVRK